MITLEQLEEMRLKIKSKLTTIIAIAILAGIIIVLTGAEPFLLIIVVMGAIILGVLLTHKQRIEYTLAFKKFFVNTSLQSIFTDLKYSPEKGIARDVIASTKMMYMGDVYHSNDFISGKYKDIRFIQSDVHIEDERTRTDSNGNTETYYVTLFMGRWMIFEFNKPFKANIQVCQKGFGNNRVGGGLFSNDIYHEVKLESLEFNKCFKTYAQSEHEAFYILTPSLMEKIMKLDQLNDGKLLLCFVDNKLHVGLYDGKDSFEHAPIFSAINPEQIKTNIATDISKITMFIDELDLDNDLFRREV